MNQFELFCMIFYALDAEWNETHDAVVGEYLSSANPFLFTDNSSADPDVFIRFCEVVGKQITIGNSYSLAQRYIDALCNSNLAKAFSSVSQLDWEESVSDYLSQPHKGSK